MSTLAVTSWASSCQVMVAGDVGWFCVVRDQITGRNDIRCYAQESFLNLTYLELNTINLPNEKLYIYHLYYFQE